MIQLRNILAVFFTPKKAFQALMDRPRALAAILLLILSGWAVNATVSARIDQGAQVRLTAEELASEPGKKVSETEIKKEAIRALNVRRIAGYVVVLFGLPILILLLTKYFWLFGKFVRQKIPYKNCFTIIAHVLLPLGLRQLMSIPVILTYPSLDPLQTKNLFKTDLGSYVPLPGAWLIDPFWIWMAVLLALAGRTAGWKTWKYVLAGVIFWLVLGFIGRVLV